MQTMHFLFPYLLHGYHNDDGAIFFFLLHETISQTTTFT